MSAPRPARSCVALCGAFAALLVAVPAGAHPHVFVEAKVAIAFDAAGRLAGVRHSWTFDEAFSADILSQNDGDGDGALSAAELAAAAASSMTWVEAFHYFTRVTVAAEALAFGTPTETSVASDGGRLTLAYHLPLKVPAAPQAAGVDVFDPDYYFSFAFSRDDPFGLSAAPAGCAARRKPSDGLDPAAAIALRAITAGRDKPAAVADPAAGFPTRLQITCP